MQGVSKDFLNECGGVDAPFAECLADVPAEVHQVDAFDVLYIILCKRRIRDSE